MSSFSTAAARHRCRNSQIWQCLLSISGGGFASSPGAADLVQHLLRLPVELRVQPDLSQPGLRAAGHQSDGGPQPLHAGEGQPEHGQQQLLLPAHLSPWLWKTGR